MRELARWILAAGLVVLTACPIGNREGADASQAGDGSRPGPADSSPASDASGAKDGSAADAASAGDCSVPDGSSSAIDASSPDAATNKPDANLGDAGIPEPFLFDPNPPTTLLAAGTTTVSLTVKTSVSATCGFSVGGLVDLSQMTAFKSGDGTEAHAADVPVDPDATKINEVYVRCDPLPSEVLHLSWRAIASVKPSYPRTGNLWGWWQVVDDGGVPHAARIDLYLGADPKTADIQQLRSLNPNVLILTSINTVERTDSDPTPDDYWLKDVNGKKIEVWPGAYRLNLTKPEVAEFQARYAYQQILDSGLLLDGCFFDNFFTSQSWLTADMWGNPVQIDADGDGQPDDPVKLDAAWRAGVFHELETWRQLMPWALASGHLPRPPTAELGALFNGDSIGFMSPEVREGVTAFSDLWDTYFGWWQVGQSPAIPMIEGAPRLEISYGYGYSPKDAIPTATWEYARTDYPAMRFALAMALLGDGYFAYEFGDTWHGNDWWYDELDFPLGKACGAAQRVKVGTTSPTNLVDNGDFEQPLSGTWSSWFDSTTGAQATFTEDTSEHAQGAASLHAHVANAGDGVDWKIATAQSNRSVTQDVVYDLTFFAKANVSRDLGLILQRQTADWRNYGLSRTVAIDTSWKQYLVTFKVNETASDARLQFSFGAVAGDVWIDAVSVVEHPADVFRRDFEQGVAIINATNAPQTLALAAGYSRLTGTQAARDDFIVDDADAAFSGSADWSLASFDSGTWKATGPWFHDWGNGCHKATAAGAQAQWTLAIAAADTYTIDAWWAAAPEAAGSWGNQVVFEVVAGGKVVATKTLDQRSGGDQWNNVASVALAPADAPMVRVRNTGSGAAIADAIHLQSAARYNDGQAAPSVALKPMDGIVLKRDAPGCP